MTSDRQCHCEMDISEALVHGPAWPLIQRQASHPLIFTPPPPLLVVLKVKANHYRWICHCISIRKKTLHVGFQKQIKMQGDGCFLFTEITCFFFTCSFYFHIDGFLSITIYKSTERKELSSCSVEQVQDVLAPVLDSDHIINLTLNRAIQGTFATWVKVQKGLRSSRSIEIITLFSPSGLEVTDFLNFGLHGILLR